MTGITCEIKELAIVLVGNFNPVIFHPQWLLRKGLIREGEADTAKIKISHQDVTEYELEDYCLIQVVANKFLAVTRMETHFRSMKDLVCGIFQILPECPVLKIGINLRFFYRFGDKESYVGFGHRLVPKDDLWNDVQKEPGLLSLSMEGRQTDDVDGKKIINIKASSALRPFCVEISVNDHMDLFPQGDRDPQFQADTSELLSRLNSEFDNSLKQSEEMINKVFKYASSSK